MTRTYSHDSLSFVDEVSNFCPDNFMAILDVESLFTNILLNEVIDVAVGSPFSLILANAFLCYFEKQWLSECPPPLIFYPKSLKDIHVDDNFVIFHRQSHLKDFVNYINTQTPKKIGI